MGFNFIFNPTLNNLPKITNYKNNLLLKIYILFLNAFINFDIKL